MARDRARQVSITALAFALAWSVGPGAQSRQSRPTFRAEVDYVQIPVRVLDARGEFVHGLTQPDFQIFEDGILQTITAFTAVDIPFVRQNSRPAARSRPADPVTSEVPQRVDGRVYAFVLDNSAMDSAIGLRVRQLVRRFIRDQFAVNDVAAIVLTGAGRGQAFTSDTRLLDAALERFQGDLQPPGERIHQSATVIGDTADAMSAIKGRRKALVLITASQVCSIEVSTCRESLDHALRVSGQSEVSIYAIDARGLPANDRTSAEHANPNSTYVDGSYVELSSGAAARSSFERARADFHGATSGARYLAEASGGFALVNTNSIDEGFSRLVRENSSYYLLGYYSTNKIADGKLRINRVTTSRKNLRAVYRSGYVARLSPSGSHN